MASGQSSYDELDAIYGQTLAAGATAMRELHDFQEGQVALGDHAPHRSALTERLVHRLESDLPLQHAGQRKSVIPLVGMAERATSA